jgi:hypothetical protein
VNLSPRGKTSLKVVIIHIFLSKRERFGVDLLIVAFFTIHPLRTWKVEKISLFHPEHQPTALQLAPSS